MDFSIILVDPARPGNIGAAARAMNTMGFSDLRLVSNRGPSLLSAPEARAFAHGSTNILDHATVFPALRDALTDRDLTVGTTARRRGKRDDYYPPDALRDMLCQGTRGVRIALVFGREESGLSNDELDLCQITTAIPMRKAYPSLNLAQAVMVYCYALAPLTFETAEPVDPDAESATMNILIGKAEQTLLRLGFDPGRALFKRILERVGAVTRKDSHLILSVINAINRHVPDREG